MTLSQYKFVSKYLQIFVRENFEIKDISHGRPTLVAVEDEYGFVDSILSKDEYYKAFAKDEEDEDDNEEEIPSYGDIVFSHGGFTRVTLVDKSGKEFIGKYSFKKEQFVKSKGIVRAISSALRSTGALKGFDEFISKTSKEKASV